jgi:peptidoglycan/xylan/chitin deacetylase (PgdA/CDA1 family)
LTNNKLTILLYHGVTSYSDTGIENYAGKHIAIKDFEEQIKLIQKKCTLLSMDDIINIHNEGARYPKNAVAVTFDDGFQNNYSKATAILDKYKCPATFYICAGMINTNLMFWVDKIEDCINRTKKLSLTLFLEKNLTLPLSNNREKIVAVNIIKKYCKNSKAELKDSIIEELIKKTEINPSVEASPNYKMMSWKEVKEINSNSLFTIGGHTLYHDIMAAQEIAKVRLDLDTTISLLDYNLEQSTIHFSYPEGQSNHYSNAVISALIEKGIICSPSAIDGTNTNEDLFNLKRIMPNFMGREFPLEY